MKVIDPNKFRLAPGYTVVDYNAITPDTVEALLSRMQARVAKDRWWAVRRNGATKRWKTRPGHFRIPIAIGWRSYGYVTHDDFVESSTMTDPKSEIISEFRNVAGKVFVLSKQEHFAQWSVECYDKSDICQWCCAYQHEDDARKEFARWKASEPQEQV